LININFMTTEQKEDYLAKAKKTLESKQSAIKRETERIPVESLKLKEANSGSAGDELTYQTMLAIYRRRFNDLRNLHPSPYFCSCLVKFDGEEGCREMYFAKFAFDQESIYSWTSPVSQIRFESPGPFEFEAKDKKQTGRILKKDQYLIVDGKILFLATENEKIPRELVYQEYFSTRKTEFILPEIVAQMEKAQDQVVRASFGGALAVTGPAGSGKTTLALHRVAYLLQSPETADKLSDGEVIVFVQDESTRDYFSHLLPDLGIKDVEITTLSSWAKRILPLAGWLIDEHERDEDFLYIWSKIKALEASPPATWRKDWFNILKETYASHLDNEQKRKLLDQKNKKVLDRVDLAVLLPAIFEAEGCFNIEREYYVIGKNQELKRRTGRFPTAYKLIIIDEFQNYLSEQLALFGRALDQVGGETVYIGDFNQRVRLGALRNIDAIGGELPAERLVKLSKVYRNTKEVLLYLRDLGYDVNIPETIKSGPAVEEAALSREQEALYIEQKLESLGAVSVGILSHDEETVAFYRQKFAGWENIKVMSLIDAQGVEFDTVFLAGVSDDLLATENLPQELRIELAKTKKDLLYIALTRAMNGLYVLGRKKLSEVVKNMGG
jgi:DNA helicase IV